MDFAKNLLLKYGWKEGEGIGKNADGILKPIKANLKFDNAGLCYEKGKEFTDHWWEKAFNNAAGNLNVDNTAGSVSLSVKKESAKQKKKKDRKQYNDNFLKSNTLFDQSLSNNQAEESNVPEDDEINNEYTKIKMDLTDADILKACGGRTAHKGARHGLSLSGKLSRINAQEQQMLSKMSISTETAQDIFKDWIAVKKKRKNKRKDKRKETKHVTTETDISITNKTDGQNEPALPSTPESDTCNGLIDQNDYKTKNKSRKKKRQHRERDEDLAESLSKLKTGDFSSSSLHGILDTSKTIKKEKSKRSKVKKNRPDNSINQMSVESVPSAGKSKSPSKKSKSPKSSAILLLSDNSDCEDSLAHQIGEVMKKHPNKKFKVVSEQLTKHQKKSLLKSGLRVDLKSKKKKKDKKKKLKERAQFEKISKQLEKSLLLGD